MLIAGVKVPPEIWLEVADHVSPLFLSNIIFSWLSSRHHARSSTPTTSRASSRPGRELRTVSSPLLFRNLVLNVSKYSSDVFWIAKDVNENGKATPFHHCRTLKITNPSAEKFHDDFWKFLHGTFWRLVGMMEKLKEIKVVANVQAVSEEVLAGFLGALCCHHERVEVFVDLVGYNTYGTQQDTLGRIFGVVELRVCGGLASEKKDGTVQKAIAAAVANSPRMRRLSLEDAFAELQFDDVLWCFSEGRVLPMKELALAAVSPPQQPLNLRKLSGLQKLTLDTRCCSGDLARAQILDEHSDMWASMRTHGFSVPNLQIDTITSSLLQYLTSERIATLEIRLPNVPGDFVADVETMRSLAKQFWGDTVPVLLRCGLRGLTVMFYEPPTPTDESPWNPTSEPSRRWGLEYMSKHAHKYRPYKLRYLNLLVPAVKNWTESALRALAIIASRNKGTMLVALTALLNRPDAFLDEVNMVEMEINSWLENPQNCASRKFRFTLAWQCLCYCGGYAELIRFRDLDKSAVGVTHRVVNWKPVRKVVVDDDDDEEDIGVWMQR